MMFMLGVLTGLSCWFMAAMTRNTRERREQQRLSAFVNRGGDMRDLL
jgi:hypothetical protein